MGARHEERHGARCRYENQTRDVRKKENKREQCKAQLDEGGLEGWTVRVKGITKKIVLG